MTDVNSLGSYLDARLIAVHSDISSSKKLLQKIAKLLALPLTNNCPYEDQESCEKDIYRCLLEREKLGNTGIGNGIAIPHSRYDFTDQAIVAIVTLETPIDFDSHDRQAVDVAFGLLVPKEANQEHLSILADIARLMSQPSNRESLLSATSAQQALNLIKNLSFTGE